jgi:alpha-glucosidase
MYLPEGDWYNFWTDELLSGKKEIIVDTPLDQIPLFVKAGAIVPMQPKMQYIDEFIPENITLHVFKGLEETDSILYEDDGLTKDFEIGISTLHAFQQKPEAGKTVIHHHIDHEYDAGYKGYQIVLHGFENLLKILIDGKEKTLIEGQQFIADKHFEQIEIIYA